MKRNGYFLLLIIVAFLNATYLNAQTTIEKTNNSWNILVDGKPFNIKGVTFGFDNDYNNYENYFQDLKSLGVNSIRTWNIGKNTQKLLDVAHAFDIKVMVGIWLRHGRPGMEADDSFNYLEDKQGMDDMYKDAINAVEKYKNHPAVLTWGVGNEVYLNIATDEEKEAYSIFLEKVCSKIKEIDPNHLITSVEAWTFGLDWWQKLVPSVDIYGINCYGAGATILPEEFKKKGVDKPYVITEFGVTGEWDVQKDKNGIKIEPNDTQKYDAIATGYHNWINNKAANLGVYVFHYANSDNFVSPWLLMKHRNMYRPQYWAVRKAYMGEEPINNVPIINTFKLPDSSFKSDTWIPVTLEVSDVENDMLEVSFYYNQRTGSRKRRDQLNKLEFRGNKTEGFEIKLPKEDGAIKVYVNVNDTYKNVGIASTSIVIKNDNPVAGKYLVPKVKLPFYVYKDGKDMPYIPSGLMGNYKAITVDNNNKEQTYSGESSIKISYNQDYDWYGVGFVDPPNDWGEMLGGFNISGAKKFSFWAKASKKHIIATIGFGLIGKDKPYPDTAKESIEIKLSTKWKKHTINLKKLDLSCIRSGLVLFSQSYGSPQDIYIDDVVFE